MSKIAEKYTNVILSTFLENNNLLHHSQTGFRPQQGTETALVAVMEEARKIMDDGGCAVLTLLDLSAAVDTVNHHLLIHRLKEIGVQGMALDWIQSFLQDRAFIVFEGEYTSNRTPLTWGSSGFFLEPHIVQCLYELFSISSRPFRS